MLRSGPAIALAAAAALVLASRPGRGQDPDRERADPEVFEQAWRIVRDQFYDRGMNGCDWTAARARWLAKARDARDRRALHEVVIQMMAELKTSHTALVEADVYREHYDNEAKGTLAWRHGLDFVHQDGSFWVHDVSPGSPADAAGILRGDRLAQVDGQAAEVERLRPAPWDAGLGGPRGYFLPIAGDPTRPVALRFQRFEGKRGTYQVSIVARQWSDTEATRTSVSVRTIGGIPIGYVRLYHLLTEEIVDILGEAMSDRLAATRALVVDLRGRGGLPQAVDRLIELFERSAPGGPRWSRPAVIAVDRGTRSAKEVAAWRWRERRIGPIVGERTAGAVLGARFFELRDKSLLLLPNYDLRTMTGGVVLEGKGVVPDVEEKDTIPWAQGKDPIVERALLEAQELALRRRRAGRAHGWY